MFGDNYLKKTLYWLGIFFDEYTLLSINTPVIRAHETVAGTKNAGADKNNPKKKTG